MIQADPHTWLPKRPLDRGERLPATFEGLAVQLQRVSSQDSKTLAEIGRLRVRVWDREKPTINPNLIHDGMWTDKFDLSEESEHWVVRVGSQIVAAGRVSLHKRAELAPDFEVYAPYMAEKMGTVSSLNRMVVLPEYQGYGLSRILDQIRLLSAVEKGSQTTLAYAVGTNRAASLLRWGFEEYGVNHEWSIYPDHGGPFHVLMATSAAISRKIGTIPEATDALDSGQAQLSLDAFGRLVF